jgi:serine acetyltransferase
VKTVLLNLWMIDRFIRMHIRWSTWWYRRVPVIGRPVSMIMDRVLLMMFGIDLMSDSIKVAQLSISHPVGVLLGGNGLVSRGRVAIMAGVKFVGRKPTDPDYLERHRQRRVFDFGDNVVIGTNSVIVGPVDICDNVTIGSMSLVNRSITEPGLYVGCPVRKVGDEIPSDEWVAHLAKPVVSLSSEPNP